VDILGTIKCYLRVPLVHKENIPNVEKAGLGQNAHKSLRDILSNLHTVGELTNKLEKKSTAIQQNPNFLTFREPKNIFQGINSASICNLAGQYDNLIPTRLLVPTDCLKIPAQGSVKMPTKFSKKACALETKKLYLL
jgi:hypothetical protein